MIEKPEHFIDLDVESDQIFISNNGSDSISVVNLISNNVERITVEAPRNLVYSPNLKRLYVISGHSGIRKFGTGKKISIIDLVSKKIVKEIGRDEGFGGISVNFKQGKIYVTQHKKKKILKIDEKTLEIEKEFDVKGKYKQIIVNKNTDELILAGTFGIFGKHTIACFNEDVNTTKKIFKQTHMGYTDDFSMKFYPKQNVILAYLQTTRKSYSDIRIHTINYDKPDWKKRFTDSGEILESFDLDESRKLVYYVRNSTSGEYQITKMKSPKYSKERFDLEKYIIPLKLIINPKTGNLFLIGIQHEQYVLCEISV